jgi:hypothetical protein
MTSQRFIYEVSDYVIFTSRVRPACFERKKEKRGDGHAVLPMWNSTDMTLRAEDL